MQLKWFFWLFMIAWCHMLNQRCWSMARQTQVTFLSFLFIRLYRIALILRLHNQLNLQMGWFENLLELGPYSIVLWQRWNDYKRIYQVIQKLVLLLDSGGRPLCKELNLSGHIGKKFWVYGWRQKHNQHCNHLCRFQ